MSRKSFAWIAIGLLVVVAVALAACGTTATTTTTAQVTTTGSQAGLSVGVVLPTKDEPRWIQDETRFSDAFKAAGYRGADPLQPG